MKTCSKCGQTKTLGEFSRDSRSRDGLRRYCRACAREYNAKWLKDNPTYHAQWHKDNPEYSARYYAANLDRMRDYRARPEVKERTRKNALRYRAEHKEKARAYQARYIAENQGRINAINAQRRALKAKATVGDPAEMAAIYDLAQNGDYVYCYLCGELVPKGERHVDHVIPLSKGGLHAASNLRITHAECNLKKHTKLPEEIGVLDLVAV